MDPNETMRLASEAATVREWEDHMHDYFDWLAKGGMKASTDAYMKAVAHYDNNLV